jgi:hypothetical protein
VGKVQKLTHLIQTTSRHRKSWLVDLPASLGSNENKKRLLLRAATLMLVNDYHSLHNNTMLDVSLKPGGSYAVYYNILDEKYLA